MSYTELLTFLNQVNLRNSRPLPFFNLDFPVVEIKGMLNLEKLQSVFQSKYDGQWVILKSGYNKCYQFLQCKVSVCDWQGFLEGQNCVDAVFWEASGYL